MKSEEYKRLVTEIYEERRSSKLKRHRVILEKAWLEMKIEEGAKCEKCEADGSSKRNSLTLDHIIPMALLEQFGCHPNYETDEINYQVMCHRCNSFKGSRLDFGDPRTKQLLLKFINEIK